MNFNLLNRRLHLYLGLALLPWLVMYAVTAVPIAHPTIFQRVYGDSRPKFTKRFEGPYTIDVPDRVDQLRPAGAKIAADLELAGRLFHVGRPNRDMLTVYLFDFWNATRVSYSIPRQRLLAEDREFRWDAFLSGMHARGGFQQDSWLSDWWAVVIDAVCLGIFLWTATGLVMWWPLARTRLWGGLALTGGILAAVVFVFGL